jgi:putative SOS response-associated peptidase YedK
MCNRYQPASHEKIQDVLGVRVPEIAYRPGLGPWGTGPFIRAGVTGMECVVGQWALIPPFSKERINRKIMTNNARSETVATKPVFRQAWAKGQRCLIPAMSYDEPCWETGANVWWSFRRRDGLPWMLAGLWSDWVDHDTGEVIPSYTMLTANCDGHPLLSRMHKPDPKLPEDAQDKRTVIPLAKEAWETWLTGATEDAQQLIQVPPLELFEASPAR